MGLIIVLDCVQVVQHYVEDVLKIVYAFRRAAYLAEIIKLGGATAHRRFSSCGPIIRRRRSSDPSYIPTILYQMIHGTSATTTTPM